RLLGGGRGEGLVDGGEVLHGGHDGDRGGHQQLARDGAERAHGEDATEAADGRGRDERAEHADDGGRGDGRARDAAEQAADGRAVETADHGADRGAHADGGGHAAPGGLLTLVLALPRRLVLVGQGDGGVDGVLAVELRGQGRGAAVDLGGDREDEIVHAERQFGAREGV